MKYTAAAPHQVIEWSSISEWPRVSVCRFAIDEGLSVEDISVALCNIWQRHEALGSRLILLHGRVRPLLETRDRKVPPVIVLEEAEDSIVADALIDSALTQIEVSDDWLGDIHIQPRANQPTIIILRHRAEMVDPESWLILRDELANELVQSPQKERLDFSEFTGWIEDQVGNFVLDKDPVSPNGKTASPLPLEKSNRVATYGQIEMLAGWVATLKRFFPTKSAINVDVAQSVRSLVDGDVESGIGTYRIPARIEIEIGLDEAFATLLRSRELKPVTYEFDSLALPASIPDASFASFVVEKPRNGPVVLEAIDWLSGRSPIVLVCSALGDRVSARVYYDTSRFDSATAEAMQAAFSVLLGHGLRAGDTSLEDLVLASNDLSPPIAVGSENGDWDCCFLSRFEDVAIKQPKLAAIRSLSDDAQIDYGTLNSRAEAVASALLSNGVKKGDVIALVLPRSTDFVTALLGIAKSGAIFMPIDIASPTLRLTAMLEQVGTSVVIGNAKTLESLAGAGVTLIDIAEVGKWDGTASVHNAKPNDVAYILHTSGSSGLPKPVELLHGGLANYLSFAGRQYNLLEGAGAIVQSPVTFDLTLTSLLAPLCIGQRILIVPEDQDGFGAANEVERVVELLQEGNLSLLKATPSYLRLINTLLPESKMAGAVKTLILGGEVLPFPVVAPWLNTENPPRIFNEYGPTETVVGCACCEITGPWPANEQAPIGGPIDNTVFSVRDRNGNILPYGAAGEIWVGGRGVGNGYRGLEEETERHFVSDTVTGRRSYRTGDHARMRVDGTLEYLGRLDEQLKINGIRIEPGEVERCMEAAEGVLAAAVVKTSSSAGADNLVLFVATNEQHIPTVNTLREHARANLPPALVPSRIVIEENLPVTQNGKVDRVRLSEKADLLATEQERLIEPPNGLMEEQLVAVFCDVLGLNVVGVTEDFFNLGGDSIRSISIVGKASRLGIKFSVADLFSRRTIRELSKHARIDTSKNESAEYCEPFELINDADQDKLPKGICDAYPASQLQTAMIFHNELEREHAVYHDVFCYRLEFSPDFEILLSAANALVDRHDALRTTFSIGRYSEPLQLIHSRGVSILTVEDLSAYSAEEQQLHIDASFREEREHRFDIEKLPLVRLLAQRLDATNVQLTMSFHHAIIDGWSDVSLLMDFFRLYHAQVNGHALPAPPRTRYQDFIRLEREAIAAPNVRSFWKNYIAGAPAGLLDDGSIVPSTEDEVRVLRVPISEQISAGLHDLCAREALPMKSVLFALHLKVVSLVIKHRDCVTSMVMSGRPETPDGQQVVGMFINSVPLRVLIEKGSWIELARTALAAESEILPYRRLPLSEIQDINNGKRLSDTLFYFTHYHIASNLKDFDVSLLDLKGHEASSFKLAANFSVDPFDGGVKLTVAVKGDAVPLDQHEHIVELYKQAIAAIAANPDGEHDDISSNSQIQLPPSVLNNESNTVVSSLLTMAQEKTDEIAIVAGTRSVTYGELVEQSGRAAYRLRQHISPGDRVAIFSQRSEAFVIALVGVLRAGGIYVPIDVAHPQVRRNAILADAEPSLIICDESASSDDWPSISFNLLLAPASSDQSHVDDYDESNFSAPAYLIYTSGSTGKPKGVLVSHHALTSMFDATSARLGSSGGTWLWLTGAGFDISILELLYPLATGGKVVIHSDVRALLPSQHIAHSSGPDFSLFFFASQVENQPYDLLVEAAKQADSLGFRAIWTPERHFHEFGGAFPNPSITGAALATITQRLEIRAGSLVLPLHDPVRVAEDWAMIDHLSGGRAGISFASGWHRNDFLLAHGGPAVFDQRHAKMFEDIGLIRDLWKGTAVEMDRGAGLQSVSIRPIPGRPDIPIWISAAGSPKTFETAGQIGAGVLTHLMSQDRKRLVENIACYRKASGGEGCVTLMLHTYLGETSKKAKETASKPLSEYLLSSADLARGIFGVDVDTLVAEDLKLVVDSKLQYYLESSSFICDVDECVERARRLVELGVDEFACLIDFGIANSDVLEGIDRLDRVRAALTKETAQPLDQSVAALCSRYEVTHMQCTPTVIREMLSDQSTRAAIENLDTLLIGGEPLPEAVAADLLTIRSDRSFNMYGPTEATIWSSAWNIEEGPVSIGKALSNGELFLVDEDGKLLPEGKSGEICIAGDGLAEGYWQQRAATAKSFRSITPSPDRGPVRMYRTGDIGRQLANGDFIFLGRNDRQIKLLGHRIELGEIEAVIRNVEGVADAVCVLDTGGAIVAVAKQHSQMTVDVKDIRTELSRCLPDAMQPVALALSDSFPTTANGKLDEIALIELAQKFTTASQVGEKSPTEIKQKRTGTSNGDLADIISEIWSETLLAPPCDEDADFFAVGGNSLRAMVLSSRLRDQLSCEISVRTIFDHPKFGDLVSLLAKETPVVAAEDLHPAVPGSSRPVSFSQERLWLVNKILPGSAAYNDSMLLELRGTVTFDTIFSALDSLIKRHDVLRMSFVENEGTTIGRYEDHVKFELSRADLTAVAENERFDAALSDARNYARLPFNLECAPLLRAKLWTIEKHKHLLLVTVHHIVCDGWSLAVLLREFAELLTDSCARLERAPFQYQTYVENERRALTPDRRQALLRYWKNQLGGSPPPLELPVDFARPEVETYSGQVVQYMLPDEIRDQVCDLAKSESTTTFTILMTAFASVFGRVTGRTDIRLGSDVAGRQVGVPSDAVGLFVNQFVLKTVLDEAVTFEELIRSGRHTLLDALDNADLPFNELVDELAPTRDLSRNPLYQISFNFQEVAEYDLTGSPDLMLKRVPFDIGISRLDLEINATMGPDGLQIEMIYNDRLYRRESIDRLFSAFTSLLASALKNPKASIFSLPMASPTEITALEAGFGASTVEFDKRCPSEIVQSWAIQTPDALAIAAPDIHWTYTQLEERVNALACGLVAEGIGRHSVVATYIHREPILLVAILAIWRIGATYLPLEPNHPSSRTVQVLSEARAEFVLTTAALDSLLDTIVDTQKRFTIEAISVKAGSASQVQDLADLPAYVLFTSGSTGTPKGAIVLHKGMNNHLGAKIFDLNLDAHDKLAQTAPLTFDIAIWQFFTPLMVGGSVFICDDDTVRDPSLLLDVCETEKITILETVPSFMDLLIESAQLGDKEAFAHLRILMSTGESLPVTICHRWFALFPSIPLVNAYGPTECSDDVTHHVMTKAPPQDAPSIPIGRPIANVRLYVLDDFGGICAMGAVGELCVAGIAVGGGYINNPEATSLNFGQDPFSQDPDVQMYRTGDLVRWNTDQTLEYLGRIDSQVKVRGCRIELGEIETTLNQNPMIKTSVVTVVDDYQNQQRLAAYVVADWNVVETELRAQMDADREKEWRSVYDFYYQSSEEESTAASDPTFNTTGWIDSITDKPIPTKEMRDWLDQAIERMKAFKPRRVLEIGCGTGMVAYQLAGECERYLGIDFSPPVVERLREQVRRLRPEWDHVHIGYGAAHDVSTLEEDQFDLIVLNSVVQYFSSANYLKGVLRDAVSKLAPGGRIYLGDLRSLELQRNFHLATTAAKESGLDPAEIVELAENSLKRDKELTLSEGFFEALVEEDLGAGRSIALATWLKSGPFNNELTRYRFDAVLMLDADTQPAKHQITEWEEFNDDLALLDTALTKVGNEGLLVTGIPNKRLEFYRLLDLEGAGTGIHSGTYMSIDTLGQLAQSHGLVMQSRFGENPFEINIFYQPALRGWSAVRRPGPLFSEPLLSQATQTIVQHLQEWVRGRLPDFMLPHSISVLEQMPLTDHGKVDMKALPHPQALNTSDQESVGRPRTQIEKLLTEVWCNVLGVSSVGLRDNFFDLGGDSILSIQVVSAAARAGLRLTPKQIFQHMNIAELAAVAETAEDAIEKSPEGPCPLSPLQSELLDRGLDAPHHWNQAVFVTGSLLKSFEETRFALETVLTRHDATRLRFRCGDDGAWQQEYVKVGAIFELESVDPSVDFSVAGAQINSNLSLAEGPLIRGALQLGETPTLLLVAHHLIIDAVSWRILLEDVEAALSSDSKEDTPPRTASFRTWVENMIALAETRTLRVHHGYWLEQSRLGAAHPIAGAATGLPMATRILGGALSPELSARVSALKEGTVIEEVLMAALMVSLRDSTGWNDVVVCCEGHGRDIFTDLDVSRTLGWFAIAYPVRLRLPRDGGSADQLTDITRQMRAAKTRSFSYDILRAFDPDSELRQSLLEQPDPELRFNYFGRISQNTTDKGALTHAKGDAGALKGPTDLPQFALDVGAIFTGNVLSIYWTIEVSLLDPDFVTSIIDVYPLALERMLDASGDGALADSIDHDLEVDDAELAAALEEIAG